MPMQDKSVFVFFAGHFHMNLVCSMQLMMIKQNPLKLKLNPHEG